MAHVGSINSFMHMAHDKDVLCDSYIVNSIHDATESYYERGKHGLMDLNNIKFPLFSLEFLKLHLFCLPMLVALCFHDLSLYKTFFHRKWFRFKLVLYFLFDALSCFKFFPAFMWASSQITAPSSKALKKSTLGRYPNVSFSVLFFWVLKVITTVVTSPYHFYLVFVPTRTSNWRKVRFGEVVVLKQIAALHRKNSWKFSVYLLDLGFLVHKTQVIYKLLLVLHFLIWATEGPQKNWSLSAVLFWQIFATICVCLSIAFFLSSFDHKTFWGSCYNSLCFNGWYIWVWKWTKRVDLLSCLY
jgi:hypothetical protein